MADKKISQICSILLQYQMQFCAKFLIGASITQFFQSDEDAATIANGMEVFLKQIG